MFSVPLANQVILVESPIAIIEYPHGGAIRPECTRIAVLGSEVDGPS